MLTPAMTASRTSEPEVIIWNALATVVRPAGSLKKLALAEAMTSGLTADLVRTCGASARSDWEARTLIAEAAINFLRVICLRMCGACCKGAVVAALIEAL